MEAWNFYNKVLEYVESDGVIFIKILWIFGGMFSPFFDSKVNFTRLVTFDE